MASRLVAGTPTSARPQPPAAALAVGSDTAGPDTVPDGNGQLQAQRDAPLGGQAVLEGVMMRGIRNWAVAVRKPAIESALEAIEKAENGASAAVGNGAVPIDPLGEIEVTTHPLQSALRRHRWLRLPVLRGIVALGESL